ncbi:MAG: hypothetical protein AVDCRST_MAG68-5557, partial [uncultured Gemmatimonadetes bacterium]
EGATPKPPSAGDSRRAPRVRLRARRGCVGGPLRDGTAGGQRRARAGDGAAAERHPLASPGGDGAPRRAAGAAAARVRRRHHQPARADVRARGVRAGPPAARVPGRGARRGAQLHGGPRCGLRGLRSARHRRRPAARRPLPRRGGQRRRRRPRRDGRGPLPAGGARAPVRGAAGARGAARAAGVGGARGGRRGGPAAGAAHAGCVQRVLPPHPPRAPRPRGQRLHPGPHAGRRLRRPGEGRADDLRAL